MRLPLLALAGTLLFPLNSTSQATARIQCDAVTSMAEIEADPGLSIIIAKDPKARTCVFYVSMPPPGEAMRDLQQSAELFKSLLLAPDEKQIAETFAPLATQALLFPFGDPKLDKTKVTFWTEALQAQAGEIASCSAEAIWKKAPYATYNDVISCGLVPENNRFVLEARLDGITLTLFLSTA